MVSISVFFPCYNEQENVARTVMMMKVPKGTELDANQLTFIMASFGDDEKKAMEFIKENGWK